MSRDIRWTYSGDAVLDEVAAAPVDAQEDFYRLMFQLTKNPRSRSAGAAPAKDDTPGGWTAPFDDAVLFYQILRDYPRINLLLVRWNRSGARASE